MKHFFFLFLSIPYFSFGQQVDSSTADEKVHVNFYIGAGVTVLPNHTTWRKPQVDLLLKLPSMEAELRLHGNRIGLKGGISIPTEIWGQDVPIFNEADSKYVIGSVTYPFLGSLNFSYSILKPSDNSPNFFVAFDNRALLIKFYEESKGMYHSFVYYSGMSIGIQKSLFKNWYVDLSGGYGWEYTFKYKSQLSWHITTNISYKL